jgi:hypothetical protein
MRYRKMAEHGSVQKFLSGTPVENHLGERWSLFEFLNPDILSASSAFQLTGGSMRNPSKETRTLLSHALRPLLLRRTKEQWSTAEQDRADHSIAKSTAPTASGRRARCLPIA